MTGYHALVRAHGIIAAITFLGVIPAAIMIARFYGRRPFWALRLHIWLNLTAFLLLTVVFVLGNFAVGPARSLTNPHHGIGLAIYVLVIVQVLGGWLVHRRLKGQSRLHLPLKLMLHQWFGRAIALLGIVQIPLGLTLYGSPEWLFILYAVFVFALLVAYFLLSWMHQRRINDYDSHGSYLSADELDDERRHSAHNGRLGRLAMAGTAGAGLAALFRRRSRSRSHGDVIGTDESGTSYSSTEKHSDTSNRGLGHRLLQIGAIGGGIAAVRSLFGRKDRRDSSSDLGPYRPPVGGNQVIDTETVSRLEEGRPFVNRPITPLGNRPVTPVGTSPGYIRPTHPLANPPMTPGHRHSTSSFSYASYMSGSPSRRDRRSHPFRDAFAAGGAVFALRQVFKSRRQRKEDRRTEELRAQRIEEERLARANSQHRYTGDGLTPPRRHRHSRPVSHASTDFAGSVADDRNTRPGFNLPVAGVGAAAAGALADRDRIRPVGTDPVVTTTHQSTTNPVPMPPALPSYQANITSSGSEVYTTALGRQHHRHRLQEEALGGLAAVPAGAAANESRRRHSGRHTDSMESPPVSVKVQMHRDGQHVTLRRLNREEAAAQREERRRERRAASARRRHNSSFSSSSGGEHLGGRASSADRRWRRTEALERQQAEQAEAEAAATGARITASGPPMAYPPPPSTYGGGSGFLASNQAIDPQTAQAINVPPPPPIPPHASGLIPPSSVTSPGTETSGQTEYANNRRRRRAERAQARLAREGRTGGGPTVDFT